MVVSPNGPISAKGYSNRGMVECLGIDDYVELAKCKRLVVKLASLHSRHGLYNQF